MLVQPGNTFGTLMLTGHDAQVYEAADTDLGTSTISHDLSVVSTGAISTSGTLTVTGAGSFATLNDSGKNITIANASTFGSISALSRNGFGSADAGALSRCHPAHLLLSRRLLLQETSP